MANFCFFIIYMYISYNFYIYCIHKLTYNKYTVCCGFQWKTEAKAIFLNSFTGCSQCKHKFLICLLVDEETNGSYPFATDLMDLSIYASAYILFSSPNTARPCYHHRPPPGNRCKVAFAASTPIHHSHHSPPPSC